jgi:hypothetical protein
MKVLTSWKMWLSISWLLFWPPKNGTYNLLKFDLLIIPQFVKSRITISDGADISKNQNLSSGKIPHQNFPSWTSLLRDVLRFEIGLKRKLKSRNEMTSRKSLTPGYPELIFADSPTDPRLPGPGEIGHPFLKRKPGKLSFRIGSLSFRQLVFDGDRNRNEPFVVKPGRLSFRLGPIMFRQVPTDQLNLRCCAHLDSNCWIIAGCGHGFAFKWFDLRCKLIIQFINLVRSLKCLKRFR